MNWACRLHDAFITKKIMMHLFARFSLLFLKGTAEEACAHVSSTRCTNVKRDRLSSESNPSRKISHPRAVTLGQVAGKNFLVCSTLLFLPEEVRRVLLSSTVG